MAALSGSTLKLNAGDVVGDGPIEQALHQHPSDAPPACLRGHSDRDLRDVGRDEAVAGIVSGKQAVPGRPDTLTRDCGDNSRVTVSAEPGRTRRRTSLPRSGPASAARRPLRYAG